VLGKEYPIPEFQSFNRRIFHFYRIVDHFFFWKTATRLTYVVYKLVYPCFCQSMKLHLIRVDDRKSYPNIIEKLKTNIVVFIVVLLLLFVKNWYYFHYRILRNAESHLKMSILKPENVKFPPLSESIAINGGIFENTMKINKYRPIDRKKIA